ncbi:HAD family phosphatase [Sediminibacterium sp.]|uniref:HAD family hydrolase n=1 Tax=Sediminibacterium sp. TaxID=1917865 RepID=UPI0025FBF8C5|nr:HAD family phosphatase [Sediminibacterium sp.]MBT9483943.1 HAD family phosphatase [Sediminibacterium sp.]
MSKPIKNIIFDLGGVFLNIDFSLTSKAFIDLGVLQFNEMFTQHFSNPLFELLETGKLNEEEFYTAFRKESKTNLNNEQIKQAWNALLLDFPKERIDWLKSISKKYRIFLFSNTNQIHYDSFIEKFGMQHPGEDFNSLFRKAYYSQFLGLRKPYPESFQAILDEQGLLAEETLFIDDTFKNIEAAQSLGLQTIHLKHPLTVLDLDL